MANPMNYRSTQADGRYVHFGGSVVVGSELGHGVEVSANASTAATDVPNIQSCGDDTNIPLTIQAKGTGELRLGNSSNTVVIAGSALAFGSTSSSPIIGVSRSTFTSQFAAISSGQLSEITLSTATTSAQDGDLVSVAGEATSPAVMVGFRLSTAVASRVTIILTNPTSTATSTGRFIGSVTYVDLT